jgi:hypothetical protein
MLASFSVSSVAFGFFQNWWFSGIAWFLGYVVMGLSNFIQAWFRGEPMYMGSIHEESAYAQTELYKRSMEK